MWPSQVVCTTDTKMGYDMSDIGSESASNQPPENMLSDVSIHNWTKSNLITCQKFFEINAREKDTVRLKCLMCPSKVPVLIKAIGAKRRQFLFTIIFNDLVREPARPGRNDF